jgi:hypothetical protein
MDEDRVMLRDLSRHQHQNSLIISRSIIVLQLSRAIHEKPFKICGVQKAFYNWKHETPCRTRHATRPKCTVAVE